MRLEINFNQKKIILCKIYSSKATFSIVILNLEKEKERATVIPIQEILVSPAFTKIPNRKDAKILQRASLHQQKEIY